MGEDAAIATPEDQLLGVTVRGANWRRNALAATGLVVVAAGLAAVVYETTRADTKRESNEDSPSPPPPPASDLYSCEGYKGGHLNVAFGGSPNRTLACVAAVPSNNADITNGNPPNITAVSADAAKFYTLLLLDPDMPSAKDNSKGPRRHWAVWNLPGDKLQAGCVPGRDHCGNQASNSAYHALLVDQGTGTHRFTFALYEQPVEHSIHFNGNCDHGKCSVGGNKCKGKCQAIAVKRQKWDYKAFLRQFALGLTPVAKTIVEVNNPK